MNRAALILSLAAFAAPVLAQDSPPPADAPGAYTPGWTLEIEPSGYYLAPAGDILLPSSGAPGNEISLEDLNMDSPRWGPLLELNLRKDKWRLNAIGFWFSAEDRGSTQDTAGRVGSLSYAAGDRLSTTLDFWSAEASVGYRLINAPLGPRDEGGHNLVFGLEPIAGVRIIDAEFDVARTAGGSTGAGETFIEPILGAKIDLEIIEQFSIEVQNTFGYWPDSSFSWDIIPAFSWRPVPWFAAQIGYRQLLFDLESGDGTGTFAWEGAVAGLFVGASLRF